MYFVEFKMFLRCEWTSPYEHLCDTGISKFQNENETEFRFLRFNVNKELQAVGK